jgi:phenylacetate-CoA ligase
MVVNVEIKPGFATATAAEKEYVAHELQHHIKSYVGISTRVEVKAVGTVERSIGKAKRVIDTRPK